MFHCLANFTNKKTEVLRTYVKLYIELPSKKLPLAVLLRALT